MLMALPSPWRMVPCSPPMVTRSGAHKQQLHEVAPVQRKLLHLFWPTSCDNGAVSVSSFHSLRRHFQRFRHRSGLQGQIDADLLVDREGEACGQPIAEACCNLAETAYVPGFKAGAL